MKSTSCCQKMALIYYNKGILLRFTYVYLGSIYVYIYISPTLKCGNNLKLCVREEWGVITKNFFWKNVTIKCKNAGFRGLPLEKSISKGLSLIRLTYKIFPHLSFTVMLLHMSSNMLLGMPDATPILVIWSDRIDATNLWLWRRALNKNTFASLGVENSTETRFLTTLLRLWRYWIFYC